MSTVLRCRGIRKQFPGVLALDDVDFNVEAGTVHAIVGENGAGKSTLVKILAGAQQPDAGTIEINGEITRLPTARSAQKAGIAVVYQEFNLVADLSVAENICLGRWPRRAAGTLVDFAVLDRQARAILDTLGVALPVRQTVSGLSVAQQQMVEIAKALSLDARVLILDEPSAVLTDHELAALFAVVRTLRSRGVAIIYISHRLEEIFDLADSVTVLRDGQHIETRAVPDVTRGQLITAMVGRQLEEEFPPRDVPPGEVLLEVQGLSATGRFEDVHFSVHAGEVLAIAGLVGAGRTSVLKALFGAIPTRGRVRVGAVQGPFRHPRAAMAAGLAYLPEDRKKEGLLLEHALRLNVTLATLSAHTHWGWLTPQRERATSEKLIDELQIKTHSTEVAVKTLSGGNQQKALLARWMKRPHRVMLFDEPTRGIDVGAKVEIYNLVNQLAADGVGIVMVSSELPEVLGMADRIAVMREGRMTGMLDNRARTVTQEDVMGLAAY